MSEAELPDDAFKSIVGCKESCEWPGVTKRLSFEAYLAAGKLYLALESVALRFSAPGPAGNLIPPFHVQRASNYLELAMAALEDASWHLSQIGAAAPVSKNDNGTSLNLKLEEQGIGQQ